MRYFISSLLAWTWCVSVWAQTVDPVAALDVMLVASKEKTYEGVFVYQQGMEQLRSFHVWHAQDKNKGERQRLDFLDGPPRVVIRQDNQLRCFYANQSQGCDSKTLPDIVLSTWLKEASALTDAYHLKFLGNDRVAGKVAAVIDITPKTADRYAYRVWLDQDSGLLVKFLLLDSKKNILERFQFVALNLVVSEKALQTVFNVNHKTDSKATTAAVASIPHTLKPPATAWSVTWLPAGFELIGHRQLKDSQENFLFSDGLAAFSVFVAPADREGGEGVVNHGPTVAVEKRLLAADGQGMVTVVGEIPLTSAQKIAASVKHNK